jgi:phosphoglycolate phosphatase
LHDKVGIMSVILFDLDGTLVDTAHDLGAALNIQLQRHGKQALAHESIRPAASHGSKALLELGFNIMPGNDNFLNMQNEYLAIYDQVLTNHPVLFEGMSELLNLIENQDMPWGVVTNKPRRFTMPIMRTMQLDQRAACIVCGDDALRPKPYPDTLFMACETMQAMPKDCIYIGDAQRDIEAGAAAGMRTAVALYGYLDVTDKPDEWGADFLIKQPMEIVTLI